MGIDGISRDFNCVPGDFHEPQGYSREIRMVQGFYRAIVMVFQSFPERTIGVSGALQGVLRIQFLRISREFQRFPGCVPGRSKH